MQLLCLIQSAMLSTPSHAPETPSPVLWVGEHCGLTTAQGHMDKEYTAEHCGGTSVLQSPSPVPNACSALQPGALTSPQRPTLATPQWTSQWPWDSAKVGLNTGVG